MKETLPLLFLGQLLLNLTALVYIGRACGITLR
jgi:hypothetical protein